MWRNSRPSQVPIVVKDLDWKKENILRIKTKNIISCKISPWMWNIWSGPTWGWLQPSSRKKSSVTKDFQCLEKIPYPKMFSAQTCSSFQFYWRLSTLKSYLFCLIIVFLFTWASMLGEGVLSFNKEWLLTWGQNMLQKITVSGFFHLFPLRTCSLDPSIKETFVKLEIQGASSFVLKQWVLEDIKLMIM